METTAIGVNGQLAVQHVVKGQGKGRAVAITQPQLKVVANAKGLAAN